MVGSWKNPERHHLPLSGSPRLSLNQKKKKKFFFLVGSLGNKSILQISVVALVQTVPSPRVPSGLSVLALASPALASFLQDSHVWLPPPLDVPCFYLACPRPRSSSHPYWQAELVTAPSAGERPEAPG